MTVIESTAIVGAVVFLCGVAGVLSTVTAALCDWLDERNRRSTRRG